MAETAEPRERAEAEVGGDGGAVGQATQSVGEPVQEDNNEQSGAWPGRPGEQ